MIEKLQAMNQEAIGTILSDEELIDKLMAVVRVQSIPDLALYLGVSEQAVYNARKNKRVPDRWVIFVSIKTGACIRELLTTPLEQYQNIDEKTYQLIPEVDFIYSPKTIEEKKVNFEFQIINPKRHMMMRTDTVRQLGQESRLVCTKCHWTTMTPLIPSGSFIIIDTTKQTIFSGRIYLIWLETGPLLCTICQTKTNKYAIGFENKSMESFEVDYVDVIGQVIWSFTQHDT